MVSLNSLNTHLQMSLDTITPLKSDSNNITASSGLSYTKISFHGRPVLLCMQRPRRGGISQVALSLYLVATELFDPVLPQMQGHLAKHHGLVLVAQNVL